MSTRWEQLCRVFKKNWTFLWWYTTSSSACPGCSLTFPWYCEWMFFSGTWQRTSEIESITSQPLMKTLSTIQMWPINSHWLWPGSFTVSLPTYHIHLKSIVEVWLTSWIRLASQHIIPWRLNYRETRFMNKIWVIVKCYWRLYQSMAFGMCSTWVDTRSQAKSKHYEQTLILYLSPCIPVFYMEL